MAAAQQAAAAAAASPEAAAALPVAALHAVRRALIQRAEDLADPLRGVYAPRLHHQDAAAQAARELVRTGALVLELPCADALALSATLRAADALFEQRDGPATPRLGGKATVEYRSGADAPAVPTGLTLEAEHAHGRLAAIGRDVLMALNGVYNFYQAQTGCVLSQPVEKLEALLEPPRVPRRRERRLAAAAAAAAGEPSGSASVLTFLRYDAGAQDAPHTDRGLLTLVFAEQPGLEVQLKGSDAWLALPNSGANTVLLFAGECLQVATGNAVRACVHRVAPGAAPRRSLVMRLRAHPEAALPIVYGPYWRCANVRRFNALFSATHSSVNEPACVSATLSATNSRASSPASAQKMSVSLAEVVLAMPELAAAIAAALGDDTKALATAELVCVALRDAVAPHWRRICLACHHDARGDAPPPEALQRFATLTELPHCIVATDARQWCALLGRLRVLKTRIKMKIRDQDFTEVHFLVKASTEFHKIFDAYCTKKHIARDRVKLFFDGDRVRGTDTPQSLEVEDGDSMEALIDHIHE